MYRLGGRHPGAGFAAQGNILVSRDDDRGARGAFVASRPSARRAPARRARCRQAAGGDRRGQQSAALLVVERGGGYAGLSDVPSTCVWTTTPDRSRSSPPLRRAPLLFGKTPPEEWLDVDDELAQELGERLARLGYGGAGALETWAGTENLEERVDGTERIDPVVLEELRNR